MWLPSLAVLSLSPPLQRWLAESARLIARTGSAVEWVTPLGIPIIQPYHQDSKVLVCAALPPAHPHPPSVRASLTPPAFPHQPCRSAVGSRASPSAIAGTPVSECSGWCCTWVGAAGQRSQEPHLSPGSPRKPNTLKQKNGFPPNFIHSLDSSHMMLTALHCYRWAPWGQALLP